MKKIPTLLVRDHTTHKVTDELNPDCAWVLDGEGSVHRKWDGTCVNVDDHHRLWGRREVKCNYLDADWVGQFPDDYVEEEFDETTGKSFGWVPVTDDPQWKYHHEAYNNYVQVKRMRPSPGTYELVGPKVNGNHDNIDEHQLMRHSDFIVTMEKGDWTLKRLVELVRTFGEWGWEGIVIHHPDGRMAKLKRKDLP